MVHTNERILKLSEVKVFTSLSGASIYRLIKKNKFPRQIKLSERSSGWLKSDIENWLEERIEVSQNTI